MERRNTNGSTPVATWSMKFPSACGFRLKVRMDNGPVAGQRARFDYFVVPVHGQRLGLLVDQELDEIKQVAGIEARCGCGEPAWNVAIADDLDPVDVGHLIRLHPFRVPPHLAGR